MRVTSGKHYGYCAPIPLHHLPLLRIAKNQLLISTAPDGTQVKQLVPFIRIRRVFSNLIIAQAPAEAIPFAQIKAKTDPATFCVTDESRLPGGHAQQAFFPAQEGELAAIVQHAQAQKIPLTIQGARTGLVGGAVPFGGWIINLEKLNRVIGLAKQPDGNFILTVQPGVRLAEVQQRAAAAGLFYPPNPTETSATIGGNVNTDAAGSRVFKYGSTRDYVYRLRVVLSNGDILDIRRGQYVAAGGVFKINLTDGQTLIIPAPHYFSPQVKSSAGYYSERELDLLDLFIGSEGTLGIIAEIDLKLVPSPPPVGTGVVFFPDSATALDFIEKARAASLLAWEEDNPNRLSFSALELIDRSALELVRDRYPQIPTTAGSAVMVEIELGQNQEEKLAAFAALAGPASEHSWLALPEEANLLKRIIDFRHAIPTAVNERLRFEKMGTDLIVPPDNFSGFLNYCQTQLASSGIPYAIWGHAGIAQLHLNLIPQDEVQRKAAYVLYQLLAKEAAKLGGSVAAEHGIGKSKKWLLKNMFSPEAIEQMRTIKTQLDPHWLFSPGNLFSPDPRSDSPSDSPLDRP